MIKYELRCKKCDKSLGYVIQYETNDSREIINSASIYDLHFEVLCPECERIMAIQRGDKIIE